MVITLTNVKIAYKTTAEAAYAAGKGAATKYLATPMEAADVASMTVCNMIKSDVTLGIPTVEREVKQAVSQGADDKFVAIKGYKYGEFTLTQYIQNETWAILASAALTPGTIQDSYLFHFEVPGVAGAMDYFDLVGCVLKEYEIDQPADGDFPTEKLTFTYYDMVDSVAITNLGGLAITAPETHNAIGLALDTDVIADVVSLNMKIMINQLDKKVATKYQRFDPVPISRDVEVDCTFLTDTAALFGDELALGGTPTAINLLPVKVTYNAAGAYITFANMFVYESNIGQIPSEQQVYEYNLKLKAGTGNTVTHTT
jgi:hypothetical protein